MKQLKCMMQMAGLSARFLRIRADSYHDNYIDDYNLTKNFVKLYNLYTYNTCIRRIKFE